jgi:hypothetical protein
LSLFFFLSRKQASWEIRGDNSGEFKTKKANCWMSARKWSKNFYWLNFNQIENDGKDNNFLRSDCFWPQQSAFLFELSL